MIKKLKYQQTKVTKGRESNCKRNLSIKLSILFRLMSLYSAFISVLCSRVVHSSECWVCSNGFLRLIYTIHHLGPWGVYDVLEYSQSRLFLSAPTSSIVIYKQYIVYILTDYLTENKQRSWRTFFLLTHLTAKKTNSYLLHIGRNLKLLSNGPDRLSEYIIQSVNRLHRLLFSELEEL